MKSFAKKFMSIALAAVLLLGVFPAAVSAAEDDTNLVADSGAAIAADVTVPVMKKVMYSDGTENVSDKGTWTAIAGKLDVAALEANQIKAMTAAGETYTGMWIAPGTNVSVGAAEATVTSADNTVYVCFSAEAVACEHKNKTENITKAATCTETGLKDIVCADCNATLETDITIDKVPHNYETKSTPSTCTEAGEEWLECTMCHGIKDGSKHALKLADHTYETITQKSTCETHGSEYKKCSVCNHITDVKELPLADHSWSDWRTTKPATANAEGVEERYCTVCGKEESRAIPTTNGPTYSWKLTLDENWEYGAKSVYDVKADQRLGTLFYEGKMPTPSRNLYVFRGWYLCNEDGSATNIKVTAESLYEFNRNVTLKARWEREAEVYLRIYRNGNVTTPYEVVPVYGYSVGEFINCDDLNIKNYYKNGDKPFKFQGWYDRGGWTLFKANDNPKAISGIETNDVGGQTILYCMITDKAASNKNPDLTNPKTGDESMIIATTAVMLASAGALAVFFMDRKRRNG